MSRNRELSRLNIPQQQPIGGHPMYSPALPTSLQHSFHPSFHINSALQTPMQSFFSPQPPPAPSRPGHHVHASIAHLASAGILPPNGFPLTPVGGHFPRPSIQLVPGGQPFQSQHPFPHRNRRQLSVGGPPKAVLGGPTRKLSPLPTITAAATAAATDEAAPSPATPIAQPTIAPKLKKVVVNLPKETVPATEGGSPPSRPAWARQSNDGFVYADITPLPAETISAASFPSDSDRHYFPPTIDVFLPGKRAWDVIKQQAIEEKLSRLGVERGSGSNVPHIHAPHARAASISSPADPALLLFKLNKLQQSQATSESDSLSNSPQPPFGLSPSPHRPSPRFVTNRHGHSLSLAQTSSYQQSPFDSAFNPFGPHAVLGSDNTQFNPSPGPPQDNTLLPSLEVPIVRADSRPDFARGFGLDIPEEEEEEDEDADANKENVPTAEASAISSAELDPDATQDMDLDDDILDDASTILQSRLHSRHVSKASAALTLRSVGGYMDNVHGDIDTAAEEDTEQERATADELEAADAADEWTGSEDYYQEEQETSDDDRSIGEWSNPSDEERARLRRAEKRVRQRGSRPLEEKPRRLPNFPRPPENTMMLSNQTDDDMYSNPSEEEQMRQLKLHANNEGGTLYPRSPMVHPLPPLPHSRGTSGQNSVYTHSRGASDVFTYPTIQSASFQPRRDSLSLNPHAKPFVFGASRQPSGSWTSLPSSTGFSTPPNAPHLGHVRLPSFGKPLNVAAPEFKPGGFTFRPPAGVPQMPNAPAFSTAEVARPPVVSLESPSPFKVQGREKRQRRASSASVDEGDSMTSFRFPLNMESPQSIRRTSSPKHTHKSLNPSAEPFTFAGFSAVSTLPYIPKASDNSPEPVEVIEDQDEPSLHDDDSTAKDEKGEPRVEEKDVPSSARPKRAPIPLDFRQPLPNATVPAGLFKALVANDERTRRSVRSRLSSHDLFEHLHRPSMDDTNMPAISHKASRARLAPEQGDVQDSPIQDVFSVKRHTRRRSSLPDALHDDMSVGSSAQSPPARDLTGRMVMHQYEQRLEDILEEKMSVLLSKVLRTMSEREATNARATTATTSATEAMVAELTSLVKTQLESVSRVTEDSRVDARGEMDFQLVKDVVEMGNRESVASIKRELEVVVQRLWELQSSRNDADEIAPIVDQVGKRTVHSIVEAIGQSASRLEAVNRATSSHERESIVEDILSSLEPTLASLRVEPVDYDFLTSQLTQAVKPHISQLIDLASDKRETASLIVDKLRPLLPGPQPFSFDVDGLMTRLTTEVRRAIGPFDAHEIKDNVADLVVERLDSRLAVRDKTFNIETVTSRVTESLTERLQPLQHIVASLGNVESAQNRLLEKHAEDTTSKSTLLLSDLSPLLTQTLEAIHHVQQEVLSIPKSTSLELMAEISSVKSSIERLVSAQSATNQADEARERHTDIVKRLASLPITLSTATTVLQDSYADHLSTREQSRREMEELRKANTDLQVQLNKARGAHGQVRVEKDVLSERLAAVESDRERLKNQAQASQATATSKAAESEALSKKNVELEAALAQALARLQTSDVANVEAMRKLSALEAENRDLAVEKRGLESKIEFVEKQYDDLYSQQGHWEELRQASAKIELLTTLVGQVDNDELKELRRYRERTKTIESDFAALQKRFKEQDAKISNSERVTFTARQSLTQAQQRASEWERRAKEYEGQLELTRTKLDQAEQTQAQLEADYSLATLQLEEREANERLAEDKERTLQDQLAKLESKVASLQSELEQARTQKNAFNSTPSPSPFRKLPAASGSSYPGRPDSRISASNGNDHRSASRLSSYTVSNGSATPPTTSVWDSMHAPTNTNVASKYPTPGYHHNPPSRFPNLGPTTPKARKANATYRASMPSPTPSTVSLAPTQGDDGWWS